MGLLDVLNGMRNGPRGQQPASGGGGMSPITMAVLGLLAYKAYKQFGGNPASQPGGVAPAPNEAGSGMPGGLGGLLSGGVCAG